MAHDLLRYSTIGLMQYIAPSMIFLTAVFVFHEPFSAGKLVAFMFIWAALVVYTATMFSGRKAMKKGAAGAAPLNSRALVGSA